MEEKTLIELKAVENEQGVMFSASFKDTDASKLLQLIAYAVDTAAGGNKEKAMQIAGMVPDTTHKYFELKFSIKEVEAAEEAVDLKEKEIAILEAKLAQLKGEDDE